ncbi:leucine-rich repeat protein [Klebsiella indica]|uniref:phage tail tube protein n=1 Tax=Klebsiella TaxID=570 RepID=UPI0037522F3F
MNTSPYYYGQGRLYLSKLKADGTPENLLWLGDCSGLTLNIASEVTVKKTSRGGRRLDAGLSVTDTTASLSFTLYEHSQENLACALWGKSESSIAAFIAGQPLPDGMKPGQRFIICNASVWDVYIPGLEAGTDYKVDYLFGAIEFITAPPDGLTVSYYHSRNAHVTLLSTLPDDLYLRYEGSNLASPEQLVMLDIYRVKLSPVDVFSLINNDSSVSSVSINARVLPDLSRYTGAEFDLFGRMGTSRRFDGAISLNIQDEPVGGVVLMDGAISVNYNTSLENRTVKITAKTNTNRIYTTTVQTDSAGRYIASIVLPFGVYSVVAECELITPYNNLLTLVSDVQSVEVPGPVVEFVMRIDSLTRPLFYARRDEEITIDYGDGVESTDFRFENNTDVMTWCYTTRELIVGQEYHIKVKGSSTLRFASTANSSATSTNSLMELIKVTGDRTSMSAFASNKTTLHTIHPGALKLPLATGFSSAFKGCTGLKVIPSDMFKKCPNIEAAELLFSGCSGLLEIPAELFSNLVYVTNFTSVFENCTNVISVGGNLFKGCYTAVNFNNAFNECSSLINLDSGIFSECLVAKAFSYCFKGCRKLESLPEDLFSNVPGGLFTGVFQNCSQLKTLPPRLFRNCLESTHFGGAFSGCSNLLNVPDEFFKDLTLVTHFVTVFSGCSSLERVGLSVFSGCNTAQVFSSAFYYCRALINVGDDIFKNCISATTFSSVFQGCILLTDLPSFTDCNKAISFDHAFYGCSSLTSVRADAFSGKSLVTTFNYAFTQCSSLKSIGAGAFRDCSSLTNLTYAFMGCSSLVSLAGDMFAGCHKVTNITSLFNQCASIVLLPEKLFSDLTALTAMGATFQDCTSLSALPADLFSGCINITSLTLTFSGCTALSVLPSELLKNNSLLISAGSTFYGCTSLVNIPSSLFKYCPLITSFGATFQNTGIVEIPGNLFSNNPLVTAFGQTFRGCKNLLSVPENLFTASINATTFTNVFSDCNSLEQVASGLLNSTSVTTMGYLFDGCSRLHTDVNVIFNLSSYPNIVTTTAAFRGCANMTGKGLIFISKMTNISAHYYTFNNCVSLDDYDNLPNNWIINRL